MENVIVYEIGIRSVTKEEIDGKKFAKLLVTYLDDNSEGELWIPQEKVDKVGLTPEMVENRETQSFPVVEATLVPTSYNRKKLGVDKLEVKEN